jgi:putative FmdB family regulatory protein
LEVNVPTSLASLVSLASLASGLALTFAAMPTYDYKCLKCGREFQEFQKMSDKPGAKCPKCGGKAERQMSAGGGLVFKGSGFYLTDYGRNAHRKSGPAEKKSESGSESSSGGESSGGESKKPESKPAESKPKKKKDD